jgi:hypothetical protein
MFCGIWLERKADLGSRPTKSQPRSVFSRNRPSTYARLAQLRKVAGLARAEWLEQHTILCLFSRKIAQSQPPLRLNTKILIRRPPRSPTCSCFSMPTPVNYAIRFSASASGVGWVRSRVKDNPDTKVKVPNSLNFSQYQVFHQCALTIRSIYHG